MRKKEFYLLVCTVLLYSCATIVPPNGGANDTTPPQVLSIFPLNKTTNFSSKTIILSFDEYVELKETDKRISIYPSLEKPLKTKVKGKQVEVSLEAPLEKNTTYKILFDGCFVDYREGNVMENKEYIFSTGTSIDSGKIAGFIIDGLSLEKEKEFVCVLAKSKEEFLKGKYVAKTISSDNGDFQFTALKEKVEFWMFGFNDENKNNKWDSEEKIGFLKKPLLANEYKYLRTYDPAPQQKIKQVKCETPGIIEIEFKNEPKEAKLKFTQLEEKKLITRKEKNTIYIYFEPTKISKEKILIETKNMKQEEREIALIQNDQRKNYTINNPREESANFKMTKGIVIDWSYPLKEIQPIKVLLLEDTMQPIPFKYLLKKNQLILTANWENKKMYKVILSDSSVHNIYGEFNAKKNLFFVAEREMDKGEIILNVTELDKTKQYLFYVKQEDKPFSKIKNSETVRLIRKNMAPGNYTFLGVIDENGNGLWDRGEFNENKEPEESFILGQIKLDEKMDVEQKIAVKRQ